MRLYQMLGMIYRRIVAVDEMIIVDNAIEIKNLGAVVETRLLVVVQRVQVVRVMTLRQRDNAVA